MLNFFYTVDERIILLGMLLGITVWIAALRMVPKKWKRINVPLCLLAAFLILYMTMLRRTPSENHVFLLFFDGNRGFCREMLLNVLLFFPLGLTLTVLIGPWSIAAALGLSVFVEIWQYVAGAGTAQGSDILMNTLGCAIGAIPYFIGRWAYRRKHS